MHCGGIDVRVGIRGELLLVCSLSIRIALPAGEYAWQDAWLWCGLVLMFQLMLGTFARRNKSRDHVRVLAFDGVYLRWSTFNLASFDCIIICLASILQSGGAI
jgi:hypothetical protein